MPSSSPRILALDLFRGLTVALMILVNSPGNAVAFPWLEHSLWNGCTLADLVFPFFIFILGMSTALNLARLREKQVAMRNLLYTIGKRTLFLFFLGVLLNFFPFQTDIHHLRFLGVLQRIAICYGVTACLYLTTSARTQLWLCSMLLLSYWYLLLGHALDIHHNLPAMVDQWLIPATHLYQPTYDPEGLFSTLPAIATALLGSLIGIFLIYSRHPRQTMTQISIFGVMLAILGELWGWTFPINKTLWSSSYVLWTAGLGCLTFAVFYWLTEIRQWHGKMKGLEIFGKNALLAYVLHVIFLKIQVMIHIQTTAGETLNLKQWLTATLFNGFSLKTASLFYAAGYTLLWFMVIWGIHHQKQRTL
jgi:predicted acyltransferase